MSENKIVRTGNKPQKKANVSAFFKSEKNIKMILRNQDYSARVTTFIRDNITVKDDVLAQPFTI